LPGEFAQYLVSRFPFVFVHNLNPGDVCGRVLQALSDDRLNGLALLAGDRSSYRIASELGVTAQFSGLEFGPIDPASDRVFRHGVNVEGLTTLIAVDGQPLFARVDRQRARVFLLASKEIADLSVPAPDFSTARYFSRLVPPVMFLRTAFSEQCWRPRVNNAALIIDDPLLTNRYGHLEYRRVLELMDRHEFHTSIAFIPYNRVRSSPVVSRMVLERPDRYSLCIHGNDHTGGELGTTSVSRLNGIIETAIRRMDQHRQVTGIPYDKVMVFPQGVFSAAAMQTLKAHNFVAAVNSGPVPRDATADLRLADYCDPAVMRYVRFPLYLRRYVAELTTHDVALNLFLGKPVFLVEHHAVFKRVDRLLEAVARINAFPGLRWSNLETAIAQSFVQRQRPDGMLEVQTYASHGRIEKTPNGAVRCTVTKAECGDVPVARIIVDDGTVTEVIAEDGSIQFSFETSADRCRSFSVQYRNELPLTQPQHRMRDAVSVALRRRASEFRDNYLSKHPGLMSVAQAVVTQLRNR
jgi:hypothetical protein